VGKLLRSLSTGTYRKKTTPATQNIARDKVDLARQNKEPCTGDFYGCVRN
jgi:hypothetical protein